MRRVLSLWQPWATLCIVRDPLRNEIAKKIETRAFPPRTFGSIPIRNPFETVIHATKGFNWEQQKVCEIPEFLRALNARGYYAGSPKGIDRRNAALFKPLPLGQIIGVATVADYFSADDPSLLSQISEEEKIFGLYRAERYAWIFTEQRELPEPIPFKGRQSVLYELPEEINAEVDRQLGLAIATAGDSQQNSSH